MPSQQTAANIVVFALVSVANIDCIQVFMVVACAEAVSADQVE
jgi:hypothetical protein